MDSSLPQFSKIDTTAIQTAIEQQLANNKRNLKQLLAQTSHYTWDNLIQPFEEQEEAFQSLWSPINHLNSVAQNDALRQAHHDCLPKIVAYMTELGQNQKLYQAYHSIYKSDEFSQLSQAQQQSILNALRDFKLAGIDLTPEKQQQYKQISQQLSTLGHQFSDNLLDATKAWHQLITNADELKGLPAAELNLLAENAKQQQQQGWLLTLDFPCYLAIITYADNPKLRQQIYTAYQTRASDYPETNQWDNSQLMEQILALRQQQAQLLGFDDYSHYSLADKMAESPQQVLDFLYDLADKSYPIALQELAELTQFAKKYDGTDQLNAWDVSYYSEKLKQQKYNIEQQQLKPYFPIKQVLTGLFDLIQALYDMTITEITEFDRWDEQIQLFAIHDSQQQLRGHFYLDLYTRANKQGGAWLGHHRNRQQQVQGLQTPIAFIVCNFAPATETQPCLLTHDDVQTLFHEFGHGLHHLLTQVNCSSVAGISGVAWDAVELPSQFMENWCWQAEILSKLSKHYQTGESLPKALYQKMLASKNFQSAMQMLRQLEFALFDFLIHQRQPSPDTAEIYQILAEVRAKVSVISPPEFNRFPHGFSHIFAGAYAAGYYSYKWAEVLSSDAFAKFEEDGLFNKTTSLAFLHHILEQGGSKNAMDLFVEFRGRRPNTKALLRHSGLASCP